MRKPWAVVILALMMSGGALAQKPPLLAEKDVAALANEVSGETAKRNLEGIARFHRQRGSQGYHSAAELVADRLRAYGLSDVTILQFPADGKIFYGTQRSRPAWDAEFAELWEVNDGRVPAKLASYEAEPVVLAEDSESADVTADLVDVGEGMKESDFAGKDVRGKLVLVSTQPGAVQDLAVGKFGAAGIVSYAQNKKTAWSGENQDAIRWGHLDTFSKNKTFAFMVSLKAAHGFQGRLKEGNRIKLHAMVKAGQHPGNYEVVTATIPGADPKLKEEEIAFSCHLDHQRPGANDNASGCATILEVARTLQKSFSDGRLARPARTIRFVFPPEIEGTLTLLNAKPDFAKRIKAVVHMDMVGGGPETKAVFHVTRGPMSLPSFVHDVAWAFAEFVNEQSYQYAATGEAAYSLLSPEGGKEPLRAEFSSYTMGSDHDVYQDSSFAIPAIYLNDWPDRFIHTNHDTPANIDPTKLKRVAFIGAASGYFLANLSAQTCEDISPQISMRQMIEMNEAVRRANQLPPGEVETVFRLWTLQSSETRLSLDKFLGRNPATSTEAPGMEMPNKSLETALGPEPLATGDGLLRFARNSSVKGPMEVFGSNYLESELVKRALPAKPRLLNYEGLWGSGDEYAYEVLNFADGKRNAQQIRDAVSAEYGPVPLETVVEYLKALEAAGVVERAK
jgi:aminopeptidase YwaD